MNDPVGLILALAFTGLGVKMAFFPLWGTRAVAPEQVARDSKRLRIAGIIELAVGIGLLLQHFLR
jgi:uncharacterized membrane protein